MLHVNCYLLSLLLPEYEEVLLEHFTNITADISVLQLFTKLMQITGLNCCPKVDYFTGQQFTFQKSYLVASKGMKAFFFLCF